MEKERTESRLFLRISSHFQGAALRGGWRQGTASTAALQSARWRVFDKNYDAHIFALPVFRSLSGTLVSKLPF